MLTYCLKYKENIKNIHSKMLETKNGKFNVVIKMCYMW